MEVKIMCYNFFCTEILRMKTLNMCIGREETQSERHKGLMFRIYKEFIKIRKMWGSVRQSPHKRRCSNDQGK